jgi:hypothetical protein
MAPAAADLVDPPGAGDHQRRHVPDHHAVLPCHPIPCCRSIPRCCPASTNSKRTFSSVGARSTKAGRGEVEGLELTLPFLRGKRDQARRTATMGTVSLGMSTMHRGPTV